MARDLTPVEFPPGVVQKSTRAENSASWRGVNFIRWNNGIMMPMGGWSALGYTVIPTSNLRAVHSWTDLSGAEHIAYITEDNVYVEYLGDLVSINPTPSLVTLAAASGPGGYGKGLYDVGTDGTARPVDPTLASFGPVFQMDNWGQNLVVMTSIDGRLLQWAPSGPPAAMTAVPNSPTGRTFIVHPEGFITVFQAGGAQNEIQWCDQRDITDWSIDDVNSKAGEEDIQPFSPIISAIHTGDAGLFFTTRKAYSETYVGLPYVFAVREIADASVPISPKAVARTTLGAMWFSKAGPWVYNGTSIVGIVCDIWDWIDDLIDWDIARQVATCVAVIDKSEIWFSFPSKGSLVNNYTAIYNYKELWWSQMSIGRAHGYSSDYAHKLLMVNGTKVYQHETGNAYADTLDRPWAESFTINMDGGASLSTLRQLVPEVEGGYAQLRFSVVTKTIRNDQQADLFSAQHAILANGMVDIMVTAVDFRVRVDDVGTGVYNWTVGVMQVDIVGRGKKK